MLICFYQLRPTKCLQCVSCHISSLSIFQNVLTVLVMEDLERLHLTVVDRQLIITQRGLRTQDDHFRLEIVHHEREEVVNTIVPLVHVHAIFLGLRLGGPFLQVVAERNGQRIHGAQILDVQDLFLAHQHIFRLRHTCRNLAVRTELSAKAVADGTSHQCSVHRFRQVVGNQLRHEHPRARSGERLVRALRIEVEELLLVLRQETNHVRMNTVVDRPLLPVFEVRSHLDVNKSVCQRAGHAIGNTLVAVAVACANHRHTLRQAVFTNSTIQDQLVRSSLHARRRSVDFVQEQDRIGQCTFGRQIGRLRPLHRLGLGIEVRNALDVGRLKQEQTHVDHGAIGFLANLGNQFRLANARRAPNHCRTTHCHTTGQEDSNVAGTFNAVCINLCHLHILQLGLSCLPMYYVVFTVMRQVV